MSCVLPSCFSVFVFWMDSGKARCYVFILLLVLRDIIFLLKTCLETSLFTWISSLTQKTKYEILKKNIFWIHTKIVSDIYWEKNRFNFSHTNITFTPISVMENMFGDLIIFSLLFLRTYGYFVSTLLLLHFPEYISVFNFCYHSM